MRDKTDLKIVTTMMWILVIILCFSKAELYDILWFSVFPTVATIDLLLPDKI